MVDNQLELFDNIEEFDKSCNDKSKRDYNWGLVSYASWEELQPLLRLATHYAAILHNNDECKSSHFHLLLHFKTWLSFNKLTDLIDTYVASDQNTYKKPILSKSGAWQYLTHVNHPDKYQYEETDIITDNASFWSMVRAEKSIIDLLDDINSKMSYRELIRKWGRDFIINENRYREAADHLRVSELK